MRSLPLTGYLSLKALLSKIDVCMCTHTHSHTHTHTYTHACTHTLTHTRACTRTHTYTCCTHTHTHTHSAHTTLMHIHTCAHTRTHTQTQFAINFMPNKVRDCSIKAASWRSLSEGVSQSNNFFSARLCMIVASCCAIICLVFKWRAWNSNYRPAHLWAKNRIIVLFVTLW